MVAGKGGGEGAALVEAAFEGRKFGTSAFALQYVSITTQLLYASQSWWGYIGQEDKNKLGQTSRFSIS